MANENNYTNELASTDEDPTAELEAITCRHEEALRLMAPRESDAHTSNLAERTRHAERGASTAALRAELDKHEQTIGKLQYDIELLRSRWTGSERELEARRALTNDLNAAICERDERLARMDRLLRKRAATVRELVRALRERDHELGDSSDRYSDATAQLSELRASLDRTEQALFEQRQRASGNLDSGATAESLQQVPESYADALRRKVQDLSGECERLERDCQQWRSKAETVTAAGTEDRRQLALEREANARLQAALGAQQAAHEDEIRLLRFELGEAQDTVAQFDELNGQLASDLIDTRGFKEQLERMLCDSDEASRSRIDALEQQLARALDAQRDSERKLSAKGEAIGVLLAELAKKSEQLESMSRIERAIDDLDECIDDGAVDRPVTIPTAARRPAAPGERVSRVLIGEIDGQEVRFPLFKNRLTIGRTDSNDIQLHATWVSRRHAVIAAEQDLTRIIDWGSKNGVFVNSRRIKEHFLAHGDLITIGSSRFRYEERAKKDDRGA